MPALNPTDYYCDIVWLGQVSDPASGIQSRPIDVMTLGFAGPDGEAHGGLTRPSCSRVLSQHPRGTEIRNVRQLSIVSQEELDKHDYQKGDTEGLVNYGLSIKGIYFAAIFIEDIEQGIIKISFRSKGKFSVNQFSRKHFNGGGHDNAAGGKSLSSLGETTDRFLSLLEGYKTELNVSYEE